jgi:hypothetical protein
MRYINDIDLKSDVRKSGDRLMAELLKLGCAPELASDICFATGQRHAMFPEQMWETVQTTLDRYKLGQWETPGPELAQKLIAEKFGNPPDRRKVTAWLDDLKLLKGLHD